MRVKLAWKTISPRKRWKFFKGYRWEHWRSAIQVMLLALTDGSAYIVESFNACAVV
jgi:hypothetical protein